MLRLSTNQKLYPNGLSQSLSFPDPLVKGNEDSGNEIALSLANAAIRLVKNDRLQKPVVQWCISQYKMACANFVQGAFFKLSINSDSSFELKEEQKIAVNCLLEGRDVFAVIPTGFGKSFTFQLFSTAIELRRFQKDCIRTV